MKWTLQVRTSDFSEYELISAEGDKIVYKYNRSQQILRLRFNDQHAVFFFDDVNFSARKYSLKNIYGSEIGSVTKGLWNERSGHVRLDENPEKISYKINSDFTSLIVNGHKSEATCEINAATLSGAEEQMMLVLISLAWKLSVGATNELDTVYY